MCKSRNDRPRAVLAPALLFLCISFGCGAQKRTTPTACIQALDTALRAGESDHAAALFALDKVAKDSATDWADYAPSQRELIVSKMREKMSAELSSWRSSYLQETYKPTGESINGDWASVTLVGERSGRSIPVRLYRSKGEWRVYNIAGLSASSGI